MAKNASLMNQTELPLSYETTPYSLTTKEGVSVINFSDFFYYPKRFAGLESLVIFPDGEVRASGMPNSCVWAFEENTPYNPEILGPDVGCGIAGFAVTPTDYRKAADSIANMLAGRGILGRGNHFVDLCSSLVSPFDSGLANDANTDGNFSMLLIHTDGKQGKTDVPRSYDEAVEKQAYAVRLRQCLADDIAGLLAKSSHGFSYDPFGDWTHNSVSKEDGLVVYRKGVIKADPKKIHILPAHLGKEIIVYAISPENMPPFSSMPHGTGRKGPTSRLKVEDSKIAELRDRVYVPSEISDASLRSEHPDCYNSFEKVWERLGQYMKPLGHFEIRAYIGKI